MAHDDIGNNGDADRSKVSDGLAFENVDDARPRTLDELLSIMAALRTPGSGCPWDLEQTFATIAPYTIEEAYEVEDAIVRDNLDDLRDELGDLLLQVVYHARMAEEQGAFSFADVVDGIARKMVRRHPHVFGNAATRAATEISGLWERVKAEERARSAAGGGRRESRESQLDDVPLGLPALVRADKIQRKAARVGFDWTVRAPVLDKIREEFDEVAEAVAAGDEAAAREEIGDVLFAIANLARHLGTDPEAALRRTNAKFVRRFGEVERRLADQGRTPEEATLDEMEALWNCIKKGEKAGNAGD